MRVAVALLLLGSSLCSGWVDSDSARAAAAAKRQGPAVKPLAYTIDLDAPPATRWTHIASEYKKYIPGILDYFATVIPKWAIKRVEAGMGKLLPYFHEYGAEMAGVADAMGISHGLVVMMNLLMQVEEVGLNCSNWNSTGPTVPDDPGCKKVDPSQKWCYCHDAHHAGAIRASDGHVTLFRREKQADGPPHGLCTSVVAQAANGTIMVGRNLDWNLPAIMRHLLVDLDFTRGGQHVFRGTGAVGVAGVINGMVHRTKGEASGRDGAGAGGSGGSWLVTIDARGKGGKLVVNVLQALLKHSMTPTQHMRSVLEASPPVDYEGALSALSTTPQIDDNYFIVGGSQPGEGAVIARGRERAVDVWRLNLTEPNGWYRLQTNYDHWNDVPTADDRRHPGYISMNALGQKGVNPAGLWSVINKFPVFNDHTDYSLIGVPSAGLYNSTVWMG